MSSARYDTNGAEHQHDTADDDGYALFYAGLAIALLAGLIIGFAVGRFG